MIKVTYINREYRKTAYSIEGIFNSVKKCLTNVISYSDYNLDPSISRIRNIFNVGRSASEVNHITGDVTFLALGLKGKKNIMTVHDLGHYDTLKKRSFLKFLIYKFFWFKYPLRYVALVSVVSNFTKEKLIAYFNYPADKIRVIYNPVKAIFQYAPKKELNDLPVILQLGSGVHKNLNNLIEAAKDKRVHIDIVGWPDKVSIDKLDNYKIAYKIYNNLSDQQIYERYMQSDILYFASFYEGFGMPIIEAQSVGRPVITSNMDAMKEVGEGSAVLVDPNNVDEIRNVIDSLINDKAYYNKVVAAGCINATRYEEQKIADQYLKIYQEVLSL